VIASRRWRIDSRQFALSSGVSFSSPDFSRLSNSARYERLRQGRRRLFQILPRRTINGLRILLDLTFKRSGNMILPQLNQREMSKFLLQYVGQLNRLRKTTGEALAVNLA
jgi:hypothetical protein